MKKIITLAVMLVMCLGVFSGCGSKSFIEEETAEMVDCSNFYFIAINSSLGGKIALKHVDENTIFECTVDNGGFPNSENSKSLTVKPGEGFHWRTNNWREETRAFIEIILKINNNVIGYAVVEIYSTNQDEGKFSAKLLKSALIPKINGQYQKVTEKQVEKAIENAKKDNVN